MLQTNRQGRSDRLDRWRPSRQDILMRVPKIRRPTRKYRTLARLVL
jgi:hypothetical protein